MALASGNVRLTITRALRLNYTRRLKKNRLPDFPFFHTLIHFEKKSFSAVYTCETIPIGISLSEMSKFTFWGEKHVAPFRVGLIFGIWCKLLPRRLIPFPFVLWQSLKLPEPSPCVTCVWLNSFDGPSGVNEEAIIAIVGRVITGAHRGAIMSGVSADGVKPAHKRSSTSYRLLPQR